MICRAYVLLGKLFYRLKNITSHKYADTVNIELLKPTLYNLKRIQRPYEEIFKQVCFRWKTL